ncbi:MAG: YihY/virulence factor BrkB family protein [Bacillota bacterium]
MSNIKAIAKQFTAKFKSDNVPLLAAALAYYFLLSIVPLFLVCFALIPYFNIHPDDAITFIESALPNELSAIFEENIVRLIETPRSGLLTIGIIGAIWSSSAGMNAFIKVTNEAYEMNETRNFLVVRIIALGLTLSMIIALVIAIIVPIFGNVILQFLDSLFFFSATTALLLQVLRWTVSLIILSGFILILYRVAPNKRLPFKHIIPGTITASFLWQVISLGFSVYVNNFGNYSATYGSLGGIIILLIWFFLTGMILISGAIINVICHQKQQQSDDEKILTSSM